jgi:RecA-family ATPase
MDPRLRDALDAIDPASLAYDEWLSVGMALKEEGGTAYEWEEWSRRDASRYVTNECYRKWDGFRGTSNPISGGTLVNLAKRQGWDARSHYEAPTADRARGWDDPLYYDDNDVLIDAAWDEPEDITEPGDEWKPEHDLITYLETLFEASETIGYVTKSWEKEGRYLPSKGQYATTAGELIEKLSKCKGDLGSVLGDYDPAAGAWIRFNPLDGQGVKNDNVTEFRYALVESDSMDVGKQAAIIRKLELPVACLVFSGGKSVHAIVKVDAPDYDEYRKRVDYLYTVCKRNGLDIDGQNKNPSRLSRMPGATRNGRKQFLMATNIGKASWVEWRDWNEEINDGLPDIVSLKDEWDAEETPQTVLIEGMLTQGDKMMISGPSKAGKSFALIELCVAFAEGKEWLGHRCKQGDVIYINFELRKESRRARFKKVYKQLGIKPKNIGRIKSLDLRGYSAPLGELSKSIIRRMAGGDYVAIILDPIYKIMSGDENSAKDVGEFCNQLDRLASQLNCALIYCHHFAKGAQGQKASIDRASGSGVFSRDADALISLSELSLDEKVRAARFNEVGCLVCIDRLKKYGPADWKERLKEQDDIVVLDRLRADCRVLLSNDVMNDLIDDLDDLEAYCMESLSAWRVEGSLREFSPLKATNLWFEYPIHNVDGSGILSDIDLDGKSIWKGKPGKLRQTKTQEERDGERNYSIENAYNMCLIDGEPVKLSALCEYLKLADDTVKRHLKSHGGFWCDHGLVGKK